MNVNHQNFFKNFFFDGSSDYKESLNHSNGEVISTKINKYIYVRIRSLPYFIKNIEIDILKIKVQIMLIKYTIMLSKVC